MVTALDVSPAADSPSQAWCLVMPVKLLRARIAARESNTVAVVRTLNVAEVSYAQAHRETGFTGSLGDLRSAELIDPLVIAYGHTFRFEAAHLCRRRRGHEISDIRGS